MSPAPSNGPTTDVSSALLFGGGTLAPAAELSTAATLAARHHNYLEVDGLRRVARHAMDWRLVRQAGRDYLMQGENESDDAYIKRLSLSMFDTIAENIVEAMVSQLNKHDFQEFSTPPETDAIIEDVDLCGTDFPSFRRHSEREALVSGMEWILANKKRGLVPEEESETEGAARFSKADQIEQGAREYLERVPGEQVIYWYPPVGELDFAIREFDVEIPVESDTPWLTRPECRKRWTVWTRSEFITYEIAKDSGNELRLVPEETGTHSVGRVPLEPLYGEKRGEKLGYPIIEPVMSHIFTLYNLESDIVWFLRISGHPIPYHWGPKGLVKSDAGIGFHLQTEQGHNVGAGYLEPQGAAYNSIAAFTEVIRQRIVSIRLRRWLPSNTKQIASDETQREDKDSLNGSLASMARRNAATWKRALDNLARWRGDQSDAAVCVPNLDFDEEAFSADVMNALTAQVEARIIPPEIVREIEVTAGVLPETAINHAKMKAMVMAHEESKMPAFSPMEEQDLAGEGQPPAAQETMMKGAGA